MASQPSSPNAQGMVTNQFGVQVPKGTYTPLPSRTTPARSSFATFLILCPTSFFLGILFSQFPYDYPILWTRNDAAQTAAAAAAASASTGDPFATLEKHLTLLHASPPLIPRILHIVISTGLLGFFIKLFRPTESNMLFDGASLALYVVGIVVYLSNIVKGLRTVSSGGYAVPGEKKELGGTWVTVEGVGIGREDTLRVLSASNTILALVLVGVLVLQAGQWYAERKESQEVERHAGGGNGSNNSNNGGSGSGSAKLDKKKDKEAGAAAAGGSGVAGSGPGSSSSSIATGGAEKRTRGKSAGTGKKKN